MVAGRVKDNLPAGLSDKSACETERSPVLNRATTSCGAPVAALQTLATPCAISWRGAGHDAALWHAVAQHASLDAAKGIEPDGLAAATFARFAIVPGLIQRPCRAETFQVRQGSVGCVRRESSGRSSVAQTPVKRGGVGLAHHSRNPVRIMRSIMPRPPDEAPDRNQAGGGDDNGGNCEDGLDLSGYHRFSPRVTADASVRV